MGCTSLLTFLRRLEGREGDEESAIASLRRSRRARCARFCGVGMTAGLIEEVVKMA